MCSKCEVYFKDGKLINHENICKLHGRFNVCRKSMNMDDCFLVIEGFLDKNHQEDTKSKSTDLDSEQI
jgi:hypothetical protein